VLRTTRATATAHSDNQQISAEETFMFLA